MLHVCILWADVSLGLFRDFYVQSSTTVLLYTCFYFQYRPTNLFSAKWMKCLELSCRITEQVYAVRSLVNRSWSSFTDPGGMEGWVGLEGSSVMHTTERKHWARFSFLGREELKRPQRNVPTRISNTGGSGKSPTTILWVTELSFAVFGPTFTNENKL